MKIERYLQRCQGWFPGYAIELETYKQLWRAHHNDIDLPEEDSEISLEEALIQLLTLAEEKKMPGVYLFIAQFATRFSEMSGQQMSALSNALQEAFEPPPSEQE